MFLVISLKKGTLNKVPLILGNPPLSKGKTPSFLAAENHAQDCTCDGVVRWGNGETRLV